MERSVGLLPISDPAEYLYPGNDQDQANESQDQHILPKDRIGDVACVENDRQRIGEVVVGHEAGNIAGHFVEYS